MEINKARSRHLATSSGSSRRTTLARRDADDGDDAHCVQEQLDGKAVDWMERASDVQYAAGDS